MNIKKLIAAVVVGTMALTGTALAGPRFHGGQHGRGGFVGQRWEQRGGHNTHRQVPRCVLPSRHTESWGNRGNAFGRNRHGGPQRRRGYGHDVRRMRGGRW